MSCIFCKIIQKQAPADVAYEDEKFIAFKDIRPKARVHILISPKRHIPSIDSLKPGDKNLMGEMILLGQKIAKAQNLKGYKLLINVGREGGQIVDHLHLHLLAGFSKSAKELP